MVTNHEKNLYSYFKKLSTDIQRIVEHKKPICKETVNTSINGLAISVEEYKIDDGEFERMYVYISNYIYNNGKYKDGSKEKRKEICISSISQFDVVKNCKRCFSPTKNINCSYIVYEDREYQRNFVSFMIPEESDFRYIYRITAPQTEDGPYEPLCEKINISALGGGTINNKGDIISRLVMPKLQLYAEAMRTNKQTEGCILDDNRHYQDVGKEENSQDKGDYFSQEDIYQLMQEYASTRTVNARC